MSTATNVPSSTGSKRQISLAGFLVSSKPQKKARAEPTERIRKADPVATAVNAKRDNLVLSGQSSAAPIELKGDELPTADQATDGIVVDKEDEPFTNYPPADHPSYHPPPSSDYNHPIPILPPPPALISALKFNPVPKIITSPTDLDLLFFHRFIDPSAARRLTKYLLEAMPWYRVNYTTRMGMSIKTPRYTTVFGKDATPMPWDMYVKWRPRAIPEILLRLMQQVEKVTGETYNFALVNYYSSGTDSISYHSDSERFLGPNPCIASISLGAPRDFFLRRTDYKSNNLPVQKFVLHDGDMVVMRGKTQHKWEHSIPKRAKAEGRINITFRKGIVQYATENYLTYNVGAGPMFRWEGGKMVEKG